MRIFSKTAALAALSFALLGQESSANAVTIDFEDLFAGPQAVGPIAYPSATFTSSSGQFYVDGASIGKDLCTYNGGTCDGDLTVDFTAPVSSLSFQAAGDDAASTISYTLHFGGGGTSGGSFVLDGVFSSLQTFSFGALGNIVKLDLSDNDGSGLVYDNFIFTVGRGGGAVPEPATWAMMIGGFALAGAAMRRRVAKVAFAH